MSKPVISKKQQQKSAKKGLRNVLAQPYEKYWPVLDNDKESSLEELLNRLLPGLKRESNAIPLVQLRKMKKEERLEAQKKARLEAQAKANENCVRKSVTLGVNAVTRGLENANLSSVLLESSVESLLVKHVVLMAQNKGIPILLVPFLKKVTLENIGFASAAMGLKNDVTEAGHPFHEVHQEIVKCSPRVPPPHEVLLDKSTTETVQDSTEDEKMSVEVENPPPKTPFTISTNVYKYRSAQKERAFVPPNSIEKVTVDKEWSDFIAIGNDDTEMEDEKVVIPRKKQRYMDVHAEVDKKTSPDAPESDGYIAFSFKDSKPSSQEPKNRNKTTYLPLKVKRVQGNINRLKATKTPKQKKKSNKS